MARKPDTHQNWDSQGGKFPKHAADDAYAAHAALILAEKSRPDLAANPYWRALRDSAYARFRAALEASDAA